MRKLKFVITDYIENDLDYEREMAQALGIELHDHQLKHAPKEELLDVIRDADIILVNMAKFDDEVLASLENCRVLLRHGIGYDNVDVAAATKVGIAVANYPTYCVRDVAEQAIMLMMACQRKLLVQGKLLDESAEAGKWIFEEVYPVYRLQAKKLGIIGLGRIGGTVYRMLSGFGLEILVCDPYLSDQRKKEYGVAPLPFEEVVSNSDVVTIHCPLNWEETYHMFDDPQFRMMKETSILINTARGAIVNLEALDNALSAGELAFAGIDVYEHEPPEEKLAILHNPKAICTPHLSWLSEESGMAIREDYMDDVRRFLEGKAPKNVLNPEVRINFELV
jgi:D-3-phosphoglycerate dehydrogenase